MNYEILKNAVVQVIKENGNEEITGNLLQQVLIAMINTLGLGYQFVGIATPETNPGTPDANVCYLASTVGTYANFGGLVLADGEIAILKFNGSWSKESTGAATQESVNQLGQSIIEKTSHFYTIRDGVLNLASGQNHIQQNLVKDTTYKFTVDTDGTQAVAVYTNTKGSYDPATIVQVLSVPVEKTSNTAFIKVDRDSTYLYIWTSGACSVPLKIEEVVGLDIAQMSDTLDSVSGDVGVIKEFTLSDNEILNRTGSLNQGQNHIPCSLKNGKLYRFTLQTDGAETMVIYTNTKSFYDPATIVQVARLSIGIANKEVYFKSERDSTYLYVWTSSAISTSKIQISEVVDVQDTQLSLLNKTTLAYNKVFDEELSLNQGQNHIFCTLREGESYEFVIESDGSANVSVNTNTKDTYDPATVVNVGDIFAGTTKKKIYFLASRNSTYLYIWASAPNTTSVIINKIVTKITEEKETIIKTFSRFVPDFKRCWNDKKHPYESWPYGTVAYDYTRNRVVCLYMGSSAHAADDCGLYMRYKQNNVWSNEIDVAPNVPAASVADSICYSTNTFWIDSNGYYHIILFEKYGGYSAINGTKYYHSVSEDGGFTWTRTRLIIDGDNAGSYDGGVHLSQTNLAFITSTGRILVLCSAYLQSGVNAGSTIIYSDDNGETWHKASVISGGITWSENDYIELNGNIYTIMRGMWNAGVTDYYSISTDNGLTWSNPVQLDIDMDSCNYVFIHDKEREKIYILFGSRTEQSDGKGSIYLSEYTESEFEQLNWKQGYRIALGTTYGNFGYFGLALNKISGFFDVITYYTDPVIGACICESVSSLT